MILKIKHKYITCTFSPDYNTVSVDIYIGGKLVEQVFANLCPPEVSQNLFCVDMTEFIGEEAEIKISRCPESEWLKKPQGEQSDEELEGLIAYVANEPFPEADSYSEKYRPFYHFTTKRGWINDPNGCMWYDGEYHLYYQHCPCNPYSYWDNNHWGHAVSRDLFTWREIEPVLRYPHAASGTAFINRENGKVCFGTSNLIYESDDGGYSYEQRYVITTGCGDPKIFFHKESGKYIAITLKDLGTYQFSSSPDLKEWKYESEINGFRECPEMYYQRIEGSDEYKWVLASGDGAYMLGEFDGHVFSPDPVDEGRLDRYVPIMSPTKDFRGKYNGIFINDNIEGDWERLTAYAHQLFDNAPDGRRIRIGWMTIPYAKKGMPFDQAMTVPQDIKLRKTPLGVRICATPVRELDKFRFERKEASGEKPSLGYEGGHAFDITAEFEKTATVDIGGYAIFYNEEKSMLNIAYRGEDGFDVPFIPEGNTVRLRGLFDTGCAEFFFGQGEVYVPLRPDSFDVEGFEAKINGRGSFTAYRIERTMK